MIGGIFGGADGIHKAAESADGGVDLEYADGDGLRGGLRRRP